MPFVFVLDPQGVGLLLKIPKDGSLDRYHLITLKTALGLLRACRGGAELGAATKYPGRAGAAGCLPGLLLVFPSLIEALAETITGLDVRYPAPLALAIGRGVAAQAKFDASRAAVGEATGQIRQP